MDHEEPYGDRRIPIRYAAELQVDGGVHDVIIRAVSADGAQALLYDLTAMPVTPDTPAVLDIQLPLGDGRVRVDTHVRWVRWNAVDYHGRRCVGVGLSFHSLSAETRAALERLSVTFRPIVLVVGEIPGTAIEALRPAFNLALSPTAASAREILGNEDIAVAVLGSELAAEAARAFLDDLKQRRPSIATRFIVLAAGSDLALFQEFVDDDTVFFLTQSPIDSEELVAIVRSAVTARERWLYAAHDDGLASAAQIARVRRILDAAETIAFQNDALAIAELAAGTIRDIVSADRSYCFLYDARAQVLTTNLPRGQRRVESAAAGITSFAARTGSILRVPCANRDPRHDRETDDPDGNGDERLLVVPVVEAGDGRVLAVLVAVRLASQPEFAPDDARAVGLLARYVAPSLCRLALHLEVERAAADTGALPARGATDMYREEALRHHISAGERGDVLRVSERWMKWTFRLIALSILGGVLYVSLASVDEFAAGVAVVRIDGRAEGTVTPATQGGETQPPARSLSAGGGSRRIVMFFPGQYLPKLRAGLPLSIELNGFPNESQALTVEWVGDDFVDRTEVHGLLGSRVSADRLPPGSLAVAQARLTSGTFLIQEHTYRYQEGMTGTARVRVGSERLVAVLAPSLKGLFHE